MWTSRTAPTPLDPRSGRRLSGRRLSGRRLGGRRLGSYLLSSTWSGRRHVQLDASPKSLKVLKSCDSIHSVRVQKPASRYALGTVPLVVSSSPVTCTRRLPAASGFSPPVHPRYCTAPRRRQGAPFHPRTAPPHAADRGRRYTPGPHRPTPPTGGAVTHLFIILAFKSSMYSFINMYSF